MQELWYSIALYMSLHVKFALQQTHLLPLYIFISMHFSSKMQPECSSFLHLFLSLKSFPINWLGVFVTMYFMILRPPPPLARVRIDIHSLASVVSVDDLQKCNSMVGKDQTQFLASNVSNIPHVRKNNAEPRKYFPFKQGYLAIAILRVGAEGIHMTVDGKHITSFAFREVNLA
jgi:hypothetical protein